MLCWITVDMAKQICMIQRTEQGSEPNFAPVNTDHFIVAEIVLTMNIRPVYHHW